MLVHPQFDPVALAIGPVQIHWYGLTYLVAFGLFLWLGARRVRYPWLAQAGWTRRDIEDLLFYGVVGVVLGGRIGYALFYKPGYYAQHPLEVLAVWQGGMSFHGGLIGVLLAEAILARSRGRRISDMFDFIAVIPGLGILSVRIANFINGELWGKPTSVPWGFIVDPEKLHSTQKQEALNLCQRFDVSPCVLQLHASQLYEGLLEGLVLFIILWIYTSKPRPRLAPIGLSLICYGVARFAVEFVRVPDENRGYLLFNWVTMGQILTMPMIVIGVVLMVIAYRRNEPSGNFVTTK
jgi:phosphatidylglycerol---prolipoprotein diacylglyceryl transferase